MPVLKQIAGFWATAVMASESFWVGAWEGGELPGRYKCSDKVFEEVSALAKLKITEDLQQALAASGIHATFIDLDHPDALFIKVLASHEPLAALMVTEPAQNVIPRLQPFVPARYTLVEYSYHVVTVNKTP